MHYGQYCGQINGKKLFFFIQRYLASLCKDAVELMVAKSNESMAFEKAVFTGSLYFTTNDVDGLWNHLKDKVKVCYEIESFEWQMKEFAIYDNNGYIIQFGQNIEE